MNRVIDYADIQAISINGMLFVSGQIPLDPFSGVLIKSGIEEETEQVMQNLKRFVALCLPY